MEASRRQGRLSLIRVLGMGDAQIHERSLGAQAHLPRVNSTTRLKRAMAASNLGPVTEFVESDR